MAPKTIFYSWQSEIRAACNRSLIGDALAAAAREIAEDLSIEAVVDRDTLRVPGAPDIGQTIFNKIDKSSAFVADVSLVARGGNSRPTPNPNVLIELGYAIKAVGWERLVLVQNVAFGRVEDLPFDLRPKRILRYESTEDAPDRTTERRQLQRQLKDALALILGIPSPSAPPPIALEIEMKRIYKHRLGTDPGSHHDYQIDAFLCNKGTMPIDKWHVDLLVPRVVVDNPSSYVTLVHDRSDRTTLFFRKDSSRHQRPIFPGDREHVLSVEYFINNRVKFDDDVRLAGDEVVAGIAYVDGQQIRGEKPLLDEF